MQILFILALATAPALAGDAPSNPDQSCIAILRARGFGEPAARGLCFQYSPDQKACMVRVWNRTHDYQRMSDVCLQALGDGSNPHPWVPQDDDPYCYDFPSDPYCQDPGIRIGWHWPLGR